MVPHQDVLVEANTVESNAFLERIKQAPPVMVISEQLTVAILP